jgi:AcrR family transcriptional regulator
MKKDQIDTSAQKLFSQFGVKKVTTDDIAAEAGVSKATIYKFYRNKYEIFHNVVKLETDLLIDRMRSAVHREKRADTRIKALLRAKLNKIHELINFYRVTRENWSEHWPFLEEARDRFMDAEKLLFQEILADGNRSGELSIANIPLHSHILVISLQSLEHPWAVEFENSTVDEIVDMIVDTFIHGVSGPGRSAPAGQVS